MRTTPVALQVPPRRKFSVLWPSIPQQKSTTYSPGPRGRIRAPSWATFEILAAEEETTYAHLPNGGKMHAAVKAASITLQISTPGCPSKCPTLRLLTDLLMRFHFTASRLVLKILT